MVAINQAIVTAYEELGMTPEEIADDQGLDISVIKATLIQSSLTYRKVIKKDDSEFSDEDLVQVNNVIRQTALYAEDENLRFRAASYIRDDKKGRRDIIKQVQNTQPINALIFNVQFQKAQKAIERACGKLKDAVDVSEMKEVGV